MAADPRGYLGHSALKITKREREALIQLEEYFRGQVCTVKDHGLLGVHAVKDVESHRFLGFNMNFGAAVVDMDPAVPYDCGCTACIGGHMSIIMQGTPVDKAIFTQKELLKADDYVTRKENHETLGRLFWPRTLSWRQWEEITPAMAADAIVNFLKTKKPDWQGVWAKHSGEANHG